MASVTTPEQSFSGRIESLDSLRGLASLWVVLHHSWAGSTAALELSPVVHLTPARILLGARPAVIMFFVLSGFVLALPYCSGRNTTYVPYLVKRVCRIYLPFAVIILASAFFGWAFWRSPLPDASPLVNDMWANVTLGSTLQHLVMTGIVGQTNLDAPMWSLVQELRVSIIFPMLFICCLATGAWVTIAVTIVCFIASWAALWYLGQDVVGYYAAVSPTASLLLTSFFGLPFIVGIVIAQHYRGLVSIVSGAALPVRALLWGSVAGSLLIPSFSPGVDAIYAIAAGLTIVLVSGNQMAKLILGVRPLKWLGRVSYSLYLIHLPILGALGCLAAPYVSFVWVAVVAPLVSLVLSGLVYDIVEAPSNRLGRRIAAAMVVRTCDARMVGAKSPGAD